MASIEEENAYFSTNPAPKHLPSHISLAESFISRHALENRRVVLITSGGTTVPLEKQTVRFIDNFSAGTRGATSAEYFLETGYAVIFLHREFSLLPYSRHYTHSTDCFLDFLDVDPDGAVGKVVVKQDKGGKVKIAEVLRKYQRAKDKGTLLMLPFVTIGDYLHELRELARLMRPLGRNGLLYLAAAVSDFFVPADRMAEHKIQSTDAANSFNKEETAKPSNGHKDEEEFDNFDGTPRAPRSKSLVIDLDPVPKFLKSLVDGWAPEGMIVSYKLETDPSILVKKAKFSLNRFQHHLVIGNLLATRKWEVVFVAPGKEDNWLRVPKGQGENGGWKDEEVTALQAGLVPSGEPGIEIESLIIPAVRDLHDDYINANENDRKRVRVA